MKKILTSSIVLLAASEIVFAALLSAGPDNELLVTCDLFKAKYEEGDKLRRQVEYDLINSLSFTRLGENRTSFNLSSA